MSMNLNDIIKKLKKNELVKLEVGQELPLVFSQSIHDYGTPEPTETQLKDLFKALALHTKLVNLEFPSIFLTDEMAELLAQNLIKNKSVKYLDVSNLRVSDKGATSILKALAKKKIVHTKKMFTIKEGAQRAFSAMIDSSYAKNLILDINLSMEALDTLILGLKEKTTHVVNIVINERSLGQNKLFMDKFLTLLDAALSNDKVESLTITGWKNVLIDSKRFDEILEKHKNRKTKFSLKFVDCELGDQHAKVITNMIANNPSYLVEVVLQNNSFGPEISPGLCKALEVNTGITTLDLSGNQFGDIEGGRVIHTLANMRNPASNIQILRLASMGLEDIAGDFIADMLKQDSKLRILDLQGNDISILAGKKILDALRKNKTLEGMALELNFNFNFSKESKKEFFDSLFNTLKDNITLKMLSISSSDFNFNDLNTLLTVVNNVLDKNHTLTNLSFGNLSDPNVTKLFTQQELESIQKLLKEIKEKLARNQVLKKQFGLAESSIQDVVTIGTAAGHASSMPYEASAFDLVGEYLGLKDKLKPDYSLHDKKQEQEAEEAEGGVFFDFGNKEGKDDKDKAKVKPDQVRGLDEDEPPKKQPD